MKSKISFLFFITLLALSCQQNQTSPDSTRKKGTFKVTVMYPGGEGKTFDMDYYTKTHFPLVQKLMGDGMKGWAIDKGIVGIEPGTPPTYAVIGYLFFDNMAAYEEGMKNHGKEIRADISKYTNIIPVVQTSEVIK